VRVLEFGGFIGLDVKAMRTQRAEVTTKLLSNSRKTVLALVEKVRSFDKKLEKQLIEARDYEALDQAILDHLMGRKA
jgi:xylose isomerase